MNKPFFIGNPIIDNYLKTPAGQEELKTAIEKIKSVELPRGLILTEKQYMQIASTFLCTLIPQHYYKIFFLST